MSTASYSRYENANFLRELAESLPKAFPEYGNSKTELLQRLADEELEQAEYEEMIREKVKAARADSRPGMSTDQVRAALQRRSQEIRDLQ